MLCALVSPLPILILSGIYLLFLAIMRLMNVISMGSFLNLQHDAVVKNFDIAAGVIASVITIFELIMGNGTFCQASGAIILLATRVGTPLSLEEPFKASGSGLAWYRIVVTVPGPILDRHILDRTKPRQDQT